MHCFDSSPAIHGFAWGCRCCCDDAAAEQSGAPSNGMEIWPSSMRQRGFVLKPLSTANHSAPSTAALTTALPRRCNCRLGDNGAKQLFHHGVPHSQVSLCLALPEPLYPLPPGPLAKQSSTHAHTYTDAGNLQALFPLGVARFYCFISNLHNTGRSVGRLNRVDLKSPNTPGALHTHTPGTIEPVHRNGTRQICPSDALFVECG